MLKRGWFFSIVFLLLFCTSFASAWVFNGTVYDVNGNFLNNTNISVAIINSTFSTIETSSNVSDASGWFNLELSANASYMYQLTLIHRNSTTNAVDYVGQSLPSFPYMAFSALSNVNFYLKQAGTINITVRNSSNALTSSFAVQIKDTKLGYPVSCSGASGNNYLCYVPADRNYSLMVYPSSGGNEHFVPVSFNWNNFSSSANYNVTDRNGANFSTYNGSSKILHKQFNVTESFARITGYIQNSSGMDFADWTNFTIVPFLFEPGNMIFMTYGILPWNASAWNQQQSDIYNGTSGFYNITVPYSSAETVNYLLFAAAQNESFYGSYRNISVLSSSIMVNFTMYSLLGDNSNITMSDSMGGSSHIVYTKRQKFNLVNSSNYSLSQVSAHIELKVDYSTFNSTEFTFMEEVANSGSSSFSFPLLNNSGFKEMNIYTQTYAPKRISTRTASQIILNNNITMASFSSEGIGTSLTASSINLSAYKSNSSCDVPNPPTGCLLTSFTQDSAQSRMLPLIMGGGAISMRIIYSGIIIHYANVDLLASGPPDADFQSSATTSTTGSFSSLMKFGSQGPTIYDYVYVAIPYTAGSSSQTGLNESSQVNMSIPVFYDEDYDSPIWTANNGTNAAAFAGNYSHYYNKRDEWQILMNSNNSCSSTTTGTAAINSSIPCHIQTTDDKIWIRLPHFSGTQPSVSGSVISASTTTTDANTGTTSGGTSLTNWLVSYYPSASQLSSVEGYKVDLINKGRAVFKVANETHELGVVAINSSLGKVTINVSSKTQQAILSIGEEKKFDVNADSYYDIYVKLLNISSSKANLLVKTINEKIIENTNNSSTYDGSSDNFGEQESGANLKNIFNSLKIWILVIVLIVIISLIIYFSLRLRKKRYSLFGH